MARAELSYFGKKPRGADCKSASIPDRAGIFLPVSKRPLAKNCRYLSTVKVLFRYLSSKSRSYAQIWRFATRLLREYQTGRWYGNCLAATIMLPLISGLQTILPYLLVIWLTPFIIIALKMVRRPTADQLEEFPYAKNRELFSPAERSLLRLLEQAVGEKYRVLAKVRAADIVSVKPTPDQSVWLRAFEEIGARNFDFVLCDKEYLSICCAIGVNDGSQESLPRDERDTFLEGLCSVISLPLVQITTPSDLSVSELKQKIQAALSQDLEAEAVTSERPFSVGLATKPTLGERPWTIDESRLLEENAGRFQIRRTL